MTEKVICDSVTKTHKTAIKLSKRVKSRPWLILLRGPVGAGKTEWVKGFIHQVIDEKQIVTSPSYSLVNAYKKGNVEVYHADLYRLKSVEDLESVGFWDFLEGNRIVIVEWGELLPPQWPKNIAITTIDFKILGETSRELVINSLAYGGA